MRFLVHRLDVFIMKTSRRCLDGLAYEELICLGNYFKKTAGKFSESGKSMSKPVNLCVCGMLLALAVLIRVFENNGMLVLNTNLIKIGFSTFPVFVAAVLYGPAAAGIVGGLTDVLGYIIAPVGGAYIPCFTLNMIIIGALYGIVLYKENIKIPRLVVVEVVITVIVSIILGTLWFRLFYGTDIMTSFTTRAVKGFVTLPINVAVNFALYKAISNIPEVKRILKNSNA